MNKNKTLKNGYLSLEYVILASVIGAVTIILFILVWPRSTTKPLDVTTNEMVAVLGGDAGDKVGSGGGSVILPESNEESEFTIAVVADGVSIIGYHGSSLDVVIPSQISNKPVVEIGNSAFANKGIESVLLPGSVKRIGNRAFESNDLQDIDLNNVGTIGEYAFMDNNIRGVRTKNLTSIPVGAFMQNKITSVIIDNKVTTIGAQAFSNNYIQIVDIPEGVTQIATEAFYNNEIATVYLSSTVNSIGDNAFEMQSGFSAGVVFVEGGFSRFDLKWDKIFDDKLYKEERNEFYCVALSDTTCKLTKYSGSALNVVIPETVDGLYITEIAEGVFQNRSITSVEIPSTVQSIGANAFDGNELIQLRLPNSVRTVGGRAFANNSLKVVHIPDSLTSIGTNAFADQDIANGAVFMSDAAYNRFVSSWNSLFDSKLQRTK